MVKEMKYAAVLATLLTCSIPLATAQETRPTVDYLGALGLVLGEIRSTKWLEELCAEQFPETAAANQRAYEEWSKRYQPFIREMSDQFEVVDRYRESLPENRKSGVLAGEQVKRRIEGLRNVFEGQMREAGKDKLRKTCEQYPQWLSTAAYDLERLHRGAVATIRKGLPPAEKH
jgi:hypothetical protein